MARLLTFTESAGIVSLEPISGPMARNSGSNTASDGSERVFEGIGGIVSLRVEFNRKIGGNAREERGNIIGLGGGANAIRLPVFDPDVITPREAGLDVPAHLGWRDLDGFPWSNGQNWSNGQGWRPSAPAVKIGASTSAGGSLIRLQDEFWGRTLPFGSWFGFFPFHFGLYTVTEVVGDGWYRTWPTVRKSLTYSTDPAEVDYATLFPTIVVRPHARAVQGHRRGLAATDGLTMDLHEVIDPYVRRDFTD